MSTTTPLMVGDSIALGAPGEHGVPLLQGVITEALADGRFAVEVMDIDGAEYRYAVPAAHILLVRRGDA